MLSQKFSEETLNVQSHQNFNSKNFVKETAKNQTATNCILTRPNGINKIIGSLMLI